MTNVVGGGDYCFKHNWSILATNELCPECESEKQAPPDSKPVSGGTMSEQQVLPELDITREERNKAASMLRGLEPIGKHNDVTIECYMLHTFVRERQLLTALASLAQSEAERERHIRHILDISIALDVPVGMNAVEYGKQLRAERERLQEAESKRNEEIDRVIKQGFGIDVESLPNPHERRFCGAVLEAADGDTKFISKWLGLFMNAREEKVAAELARERALIQGLRERFANEFENRVRSDRQFAAEFDRANLLEKDLHEKAPKPATKDGHDGDERE